MTIGLVYSEMKIGFLIRFVMVDIGCKYPTFGSVFLKLGQTRRPIHSTVDATVTIGRSDASLIEVQRRVKTSRTKHPNVSDHNQAGYTMGQKRDTKSQRKVSGILSDT